MDNKYYNILNAWAKYTDYDPEQKSFTICEYDLHQATKQISHINETYDESGLLSVMMIKQVFLDLISKNKFSLLDILSNPEDLKEHQNMYDLFMSEDVTNMEREYIDLINGLSQHIINKPLIGETNYNEMYDKIFTNTSRVIKSLDKCKIDIYRKGGEISNITKIATHILIFPSLASCILSLSNADDGIYLVYINISDSADSYFAFVIKNNGNLFSVNERIDEAFRGQHQHSRNGHWSEDKRDDIFPYEYIFKYSNHDYKGYSHTYEIEEDMLSFFELSEDVYIPLLLAMLFIIRKYNGKVLEGDIIYIDSLLPVNVKTITEDSNELMVIEKNDIVVAHKNINLDFDANSVMNGTAADEFANMTNSSVSIACNADAQELVDLWGEGFEIPTNVMSNNYLLLSTGDEYIVESVGSDKKMRLQVYYEIRKSLAQYIRDKMFEEFVSFGGLKAVEKWFKDSIDRNISLIEPILADRYRDIKAGGTNTLNNYQHSMSETLWDISFVEGDYPSGFYPISYIPNSYRGHNENYLDMRTGALCNCWFVIRPLNYKGLEKLFGSEVPKIIKGWNSNGHSARANSLLYMVDPVCEVGTPFESHESCADRYNYQNPAAYKFRFAIGYAKRGLKKMLDENPGDKKEN